MDRNRHREKKEQGQHERDRANCEPENLFSSRPREHLARVAHARGGKAFENAAVLAAQFDPGLKRVRERVLLRVLPADPDLKA